MSDSHVNVVLAYVMKFLVPLHVELVDHVVIVNVPSLALAVIVLPVAGLVLGLIIVIVGTKASITISLLYHNDHKDHGLAKVNVALLLAASLIVPPESANALVLA